MRGLGVATIAIALAGGGCGSRSDGQAMNDLGPCGFAIVASVPAEGAADVPIDSTLEVFFNTFPDPDSVAEANAITLALGSNTMNVDFTASVDLVDRAIRMRPGRALEGGADYVVGISGGVSALCGGHLADPPATIRFTTRAALTDGGVSDGEPVRDGPRPTFAAEVGPALDASCTFSGCHDPVVRSGGLDLTAGAGFTNLVGVAATGSPLLRRVAPGSPARSYLLRKLVGTPDIHGGSMPLGGVYDAKFARLISDWIAAGAPR